MRPIFILPALLFFESVPAFGQPKKIVRILNSQQDKEIRLRQKDSSGSCGEKYEVVKKFTIEGNILSFEVKVSSIDTADHYFVKQEVDLGKIKAVVKDINVLFETEDGAAVSTTVSSTGEKSINRGNQFFLYLSCEKQNDYLGEQIVKAFKNGGWNIEKNIWAD
ncbi:MAG: hypothetical protein DI535_17615 [Citrobacter freundii]|nr:MAG: hypothetical protein DI535_17615 [Citrobacter freundii]